MGPQLAFLLGVIAAALAAWVVGHLAPGIWDRLTRRPPVFVHVEADPALIHAGGPNWDGYSYVLPDTADPPPPPTEVCREWRRWLWEQDAWDADRTELKVTVQGRRDTAVLLDGLRAVILSRAAPRGLVLHCPVGGAEASPRSVMVDLDWPPGVVTYTDDFGDKAKPFAFTLAKGETEVFFVTAVSRTAAVRWTAELLLIVDGARRTIKISDDGRPLRTSASQSLPAVTWHQGRGWVVGGGS